MKDKRLIKISQHIDIFINDSRFKVLSCKLDNDNRLLRIKTKIKGQTFPCNGRIIVSIPNGDSVANISVIYHSMSSDEKIENWEYKLITD